MEHIEKAGIHSGDSACALPPYSLGDDQIERIKVQTRALARELGVSRQGLRKLTARLGLDAVAKTLEASGEAGALE